MTREQVFTATEEANKDWERTQENLKTEVDRLAGEDAAAQRRLAQRTSTKRRPTDGANKDGERTHESLNAEGDRLARDKAAARRKLAQHVSSKRRQIEQHLRRYARHPDVMSADQIAQIERDLTALPEVILTDDFAPVENLLAPVARERDL